MIPLKSFILVASLIMTPSLVFSKGGGDLGGGGIGRFALTPEERNLLQNQQTVEEAFEVWKQLHDQRRQQRLMRDVFDEHILKQLE